jgi:hypothetical protein
MHKTYRAEVYQTTNIINIPLNMKSIINHVHGRNVEIPAEYAHLIRMKTRETLADEYNVCIRTFRYWITTKCPEIPKYKLLSPQEVLLIYLAIGWPPLS